MSDLRSIARNTSVLFATDMINKVLGFAYVALATRALGSTGFGIITGAIALVSILSFFSDVGLSTLVVREVARNKSSLSKYLNNIIGAKIPLNVLTFLIIIVAASVLQYTQGKIYTQDTVLAIYLIGLSTIISSFYGVFNSIFQAHERMEFQSIGQVMNSGILLAGAAVAINYNLGITTWASFYLIASIVTLLFEFVACAVYFKLPGVSFDMGFISWAIRESLPFALTGSFITIYYMVSSILLQYMVSNDAVGYYNAAYKLVLFLGFIPNVLFGAVFPVSSRLFTSSKDSLRFLFERSIKYLLIFAIPLGVGTTLLADRFIATVCGADSGFGPAVPALMILIWSEVLIFMNMAFANQLNSINKQTVVTKQTAMSAVVNVALNIMMIPFFGYLGACVVTVVTEGVALLFLYRGIMNSEFKVPRSALIELAKISVASLIMGAFLYAVKDQSIFQGILGLVAIVVLSMCIYFAIILILRVMDSADTNMLKKLMTMWRGEPR